MGRQRPTLLTLQRVNNVGVFMSSLKLTAEEAVAAILACCGAGATNAAAAHCARSDLVPASWRTGVCSLAQHM